MLLQKYTCFTTRYTYLYIPAICSLLLAVLYKHYLIILVKFAFMKNKNIFTVKEYGRTELAVYYCQGVSPESAWRKLRRWMELCPGLSEKLAASGYDGHQRSFTPAQVSIIIEALGEP